MLCVSIYNVEPPIMHIVEGEIVEHRDQSNSFLMWMFIINIIYTVSAIIADEKDKPVLYIPSIIVYVSPFTTLESLQK